LKAEPLYQRALAIYEKVLGSEHPDVAISLNNLANFYYKKDHPKAESLYLRAIAIRERALGLDHPDLAQSLNNLASLYQAKGNYLKAEPLYQRALAIRQKVLGSEHPAVASSLSNLAGFYETKGDITRAIVFQTRANDVIERNIALNIATGSERQKLAYLATLSGPTWWTVSLHAQSAPNDLAALRLALTTILRRKGRALDATADSIGALSRRFNEQDRALLVQLTDTRSRLAALVLGGPGKTNLAEHGTEIKRLEEQVEKLESDISLRSAEFRAQSRPVSLEALQAAIPQGAALVEFFSYYPLKDFKFAGSDDWGEPRYVAYVLGGEGEPKWVDLGEAKMIDNAVSALRNALRNPRRDDVKALARALDEKVMQPVRKLLGQTQKVFLSPDGSPNLIPFAALVDEQNRYLIEQYSFNYLTSGRDLLRLQEKSQSKQIATVIANPDFGGDTSPCSEGRMPVSRGAIDFSQILFCPLAGTAGEAQAIKAMMPEAKVLMKEQATEAAIKKVSGPKILHVATHGFFLEDVVINPSTEARGLGIKSNQSDAAMKVENPLLRSGLAIAGANLHKSGNDDGVLTALEAAGLDLWGTKLVVFSACDTGVGEVRNGDGVYGLRRALVLAGSESQVMSLWPVSDVATRDLMIDYYKAIQAGQGRSEALRQVQLKMLASEKRQHPYYWASFIHSGEWAGMDGKR